MIGFVLALVVLFVLWRVWRARRQSVLAGRSSDKPVYSIAPPQRRLDRPSRGVL